MPVFGRLPSIDVTHRAYRLPSFTFFFLREDAWEGFLSEPFALALAFSLALPHLGGSMRVCVNGE